MKKTTTWIIFVLIIIAIIVLLYFAFRKPKNKKKEYCPDGKTPVPADGKCPEESVGTNAVPDPETGCVQPSSYTPFKYPIKKGMMDGGNKYDNKEVSRLQNQLNKIYKAGLEDVDGKFGCNTEKAVKKYLGVTEVGYQNPIWSAKPILG